MDIHSPGEKMSRTAHRVVFPPFIPFGPAEDRDQGVDPSSVRREQQGAHQGTENLGILFQNRSPTASRLATCFRNPHRLRSARDAPHPVAAQTRDSVCLLLSM